MERKEFIIPEYVTAQELKDIRKDLNLSQQDFGRLMGVSKPTVARWESSKDEITGPIVFVIHALKTGKLGFNFELPEMKYRLRLKYMYKQYLCTLIDVDESEEKIEIVNYTDKIMFTAFGSNKNPSYEDYNEFLESRCFPRSRDKMKIELERLDIPFYDPMMIIEKTQGRMAEDDFWIQVVRN